MVYFIVFFKQKIGQSNFNLFLSSVETHALEQSLEFIKPATERLCPDGRSKLITPHLKRKQPVAAVIGNDY